MIGLLMLASGASNGFFNGNTLLRGCTADRQLQCIGYIEGVTDEYVRQLSYGRAVNILCVPDNVEAGQLKDVVVGWLNRHPEKRHLLAPGLVVGALSEAFPCHE